LYRLPEVRHGLSFDGNGCYIETQQNNNTRLFRLLYM
jgi:hypothetical protein